MKRGGRAWRGPFVMSHGACDRSHLSASHGVQHRHPSTRSVRVRPIRIGTGWGWCAHRTSSAAQDRGVETSHLRLQTCTTLGWRFGTSHTRGRAPSAPRPGSAGRGRGWWRQRDGKDHPDHSFLLIDVDRTGSARSCPQLTLRQAQIRLPRRSRGPSAFALATGPLAPVPGDPHRNKEIPK